MPPLRRGGGPVVESALSGLFEPLQLKPGQLDHLRRELKRRLKGQWIVGVSGGGRCRSEIAEAAEEVGALLAQRGAVVMTGGLGGVMEAASYGAKRSGGLTLGLLPGTGAQTANPYVDWAVPTGWREGRNFLLSFLSDGLIAIDGGYGTLSEVALALKLGRPVVGLLLEWELPDLFRARTPQEAVEGLWERLHLEGGAPDGEDGL